MIRKELIMIAVVDKSGCIACGLCISMCPEVFRFGDDGKAEGYAEVTEPLLDSAHEACDGCPVTVIALADSK